jgi:polyhydroxybutyrate depolymerase
MIISTPQCGWAASPDGSLHGSRNARGNRAVRILGVLAALAALAAAPSMAAERRSIPVGGLERSYWVHRPPPAARPTTTGPGGLVIVLHGSGGDGRSMREMFGRRLEAFTNRAGFHVVYPDGYERHWNDCRRSATYAANVRDVDDPAFLRAIIDVMRREGVDPRRVFVAGFSNGGQMVFRLALEDAATYAGFAAIAASLPAPANSDCPVGNAAAPIVLFAGTADPVNPFGGGLVRVGSDISRGDVLSAEYTAAWFARRAGHVEPAVQRELPDRDPGDGSRASVLEWLATGHAPVALYVLEGAGHTIPGTPAAPAARPAVTNRDIDAAREIWRFFAAVSSGLR